MIFVLNLHIYFNDQTYATIEKKKKTTFDGSEF